MKEKLQKFRREVLLTVAALMLFAATFVGCEYIHQTAGWMRRGNTLPVAMTYAANNIGERLGKVYHAWFPERNDGYVEYPLVNANIDWNCLNKR